MTPPLALPSAPATEEDAAALQVRADQALREQRLFAPAGDNAFEYFLVLRQEHARAGAAGLALVQLQPYLIMGAQRALDAGDAGEAERLVRLMVHADAQAAALPRLQRSLQALQKRQQDEAEAAAALDAETEAEADAEVAARREVAPSVPVAVAAPRAAEAATPPPVPVVTRAPVAAMGADPDPQGAAAVAIEPRRPATPRVAAAAGAPPRLLVDQAPRYPARALSRQMEGRVELEFVVQADGRVGDVRLIEAEPAGVFDASAKEVARRWRFEATGQPHEVRRVLTYRLPAQAKG